MLCFGALLGVHLVEPFLILTTSTDTTYSKLIPSFQHLYHDLLETEPCKLLNLNKAAFIFVSDSQFTHSRYALEICRSIEAICEEYKPQVLKILKVILPALAEAFQRQKGEIFGFDSYNENSHSLSTMDQNKPEGAPVLNLDAERSIGFINYELSRRGSKQLSTASSTKVKCAASDQIDNTVT